MVIAAALLILSLTNCSDGYEKHISDRIEASNMYRFVLIEKQSTPLFTIAVYADSKTGVEYARFGGNTAPVMLRNADGTPYVLEGYGGEQQ